ncbi:MAG TPA: tRNA-specific adenosine deaminase [Bacteroidales bacterium]|jgi:tRNA(Arg) A34 adenosine deaminase TadA|nr:nucleoside deaminase [Lentimicrobiaceae bacterium]HAH59135.1 tRNA-specific adenosine deaminase [Bacteroidales bacterium]
MTNNDRKTFMSAAIQLASDNVETGSGGPFGAVVVLDGQIIARGNNRVTVDNDPTAHAEIVAIRQASKVLGSFQLTNCDIYCSCEPCPMCLGAIYWARPARVFFAANRHDAAKAQFDDSFIYEQLNLDNDDRAIPMQQFMRDEAVTIFEQWLDSNRKIPY